MKLRLGWGGVGSPKGGNQNLLKNINALYHPISKIQLRIQLIYFLQALPKLVL